MSLEFLDGFDHYVNNTNLTRKWAVTSSAVNLPAGRFGGNAIELTASPGAVLDSSLLSSIPTRTVGFAFWINGVMQVATFCAFQDAGTTQVDLRTTATGAVQITRNGTVLATTTNVLLPNAWYYLEFQATIDSISGAVMLKVWNGPGAGIWASASGVNTRFTGNSSMNGVSLMKFTFDDFYCLNPSGTRNNNFLGESRIFTSLANADSASTGTNLLWTPDTGTAHFSRVNEASPDDDTSYVFSSTPGQIDTYKRASISPTGTIMAVQVTLTSRKDDVGPRTIAAAYRSSGGTNFAGSNMTPATTYGMPRQIWEADPATTATWTVTAVNNGEFGVNCIA